MGEITTYHKSYLFNKPIEVSDIGGEIIVTITNRDDSESVYSWYDLEERESYSTYINKCILGGMIKGVPKKVLVIGFGGGSFVKFLEDHFSNIEISGIDIEKAMYNICKDILKVKTDKLLVGDADDALDELIQIEEKYDLILFDVYGNDSKIPERFTRLKFFAKIKNLLNKTGIFSINMSSFEQERKIYEDMHILLKETFGDIFSLFLSGKNDSSNVMGIYNLDRQYSAQEFDDNYRELVENGQALNSSEIIKNTVVDEEKEYLQ